MHVYVQLTPKCFAIVIHDDVFIFKQYWWMQSPTPWSELNAAK